MSKPIPTIDLGAKFQVMDMTQDPPRWKTIGTGFATEENARRIARRHGLPGVWINDGFDRRYVTK